MDSDHWGQYWRLGDWIGYLEENWDHLEDTPGKYSG